MILLILYYLNFCCENNLSFGQLKIEVSCKLTSGYLNSKYKKKHYTLKNNLKELQKRQIQSYGNKKHNFIE